MGRLNGRATVHQRIHRRFGDLADAKGGENVASQQLVLLLRSLNILPRRLMAAATDGGAREIPNLSFILDAFLQRGNRNGTPRVRLLTRQFGASLGTAVTASKS